MLAGSITSSQLSGLTGVPTRTLSTWLKKADEEGFESLKAIKQTGRPNKLADDKLAIIKDAIEHSPEDYGYRVWDGPSLSDFILKKFNVTMGVRQCQRLFHKLGFSLIRAQTYPSLGEQNENERNDFKKNERLAT